MSPCMATDFRLIQRRQSKILNSIVFEPFQAASESRIRRLTKIRSSPKNLSERDWSRNAHYFKILGLSDPFVGSSMVHCVRMLDRHLPVDAEERWTLNLTMIQNRVKGNRSRADRFSANPDCDPPLTAVSQEIRKRTSKSNYVVLKLIDCSLNGLSKQSRRFKWLHED